MHTQVCLSLPDKNITGDRKCPSITALRVGTRLGDGMTDANSCSLHLVPAVQTAECALPSPTCQAPSCEQIIEGLWTMGRRWERICSLAVKWTVSSQAFWLLIYHQKQQTMILRMNYTGLMCINRCPGRQEYRLCWGKEEAGSQRRITIQKEPSRLCRPIITALGVKWGDYGQWLPWIGGQPRLHGKLWASLTFHVKPLSYLTKHKQRKCGLWQERPRRVRDKMGEKTVAWKDAGQTHTARQRTVFQGMI